VEERKKREEGTKGNGGIGVTSNKTAKGWRQNNVTSVKRQGTITFLRTKTQTLKARYTARFGLASRVF